MLTKQEYAARDFFFAVLKQQKLMLHITPKGAGIYHTTINSDGIRVATGEPWLFMPDDVKSWTFLLQTLLYWVTEDADQRTI